MPVIEAGHGSKAVILGLYGAVRLLHFAAAPRYPRWWLKEPPAELGGLGCARRRGHRCRRCSPGRPADGRSRGLRGCH